MNIDFGQVVSKEDVINEKKEAKRQDIASRRYDEETKGIIVLGMKIDTGRDSQAMITGATLSALIDKTYTCRWKTPDGFFTLDANTLLHVSQSMRKHVQACFDREDVLFKLVNDGDYIDTMLDEGWP